MSLLKFTIDEKGVAILTFDRPGSSANIFDRAAFDELESVLDELEKNQSVRHLVFTSDKPKIFIAGADIKSLADADRKEMEHFLKRGQETFNRIARLPFGTAAAIHGACLGGGFELALACDVRVASPDDETRIGLPETLLGIIPAWGGSTRLPKLIGVDKALPLILGAKSMVPKHAKKLGAIDDIAPRERLVERCLQLLKKMPPRKSLWKVNNFLSRAIARNLARRDVRKKTRGLYPAAFKAIDVVCAAPGRSEKASLEAERVAVLELSETESTRQLIRLFFLTEKAKKSGLNVTGPVPVIKHGSVIGAGVMGAGIAHWVASRKIPILLKDINEEAIARGLRGIAKRFDEAVASRIFTKNEAATRYNLISPAFRDVPMRHIDLIIEAAVENMGVKKKIFAGLAALTREDTILATNTSALSITELAESTPHPGRVVGLHFFNPVHRMKLVEVIHTPHTLPEVSQACLDFVRRIGKLPVLVRDSPGFLVNRILMPYLIEAGRLLQSGVAPRKIDEAMLEFGMPVGPVQLLDDIGLDVALHVAETMEKFFEERMKAPTILKDLVGEGILGRKAGQGFFLYDGKNKGQANPSVFGYIEGKREMAAQEIADRLSLLMVAESYRCLDEGLVASAEDIDFAMILGTGWAPFRGGPMAYGASMGKAAARDKLRQFFESDGVIYEIPDPLMK